MIEGANRQDRKRLCARVEGVVLARPEPTRTLSQHRWLEVGSDSPVIGGYVEMDNSFFLHLPDAQLIVLVFGEAPWVKNI